MALELVPLCTARISLKLPPLELEGTPLGTRAMIEMDDIVLEGERLSGRLHGPAAVDWLLLSDAGVAAIDVRYMLRTHDDAYIYVSYRGRSDHSRGHGTAPLYSAPLFETGDERYAWLNMIQAVGKAHFTGTHLEYEFYELR